MGISDFGNYQNSKISDFQKLKKHLTVYPATVISA